MTGDRETDKSILLYQLLHEIPEYLRGHYRPIVERLTCTNQPQHGEDIEHAMA